MRPGDMVVPVSRWLMCRAFPRELDKERVRWTQGDPGLVVHVPAAAGPTDGVDAVLLLGDGRMWRVWLDSSHVRVVSRAREQV